MKITVIELENGGTCVMVDQKYSIDVYAYLTENLKQGVSSYDQEALGPRVSHFLSRLINPL